MNLLRFFQTAGIATVAATLLAACGERPPVDSVQVGYRGTGMEQVYNPRLLAKQASINSVPTPLAPAPQEGPRASEVYKNVQVLGNASVAEFTRTMVAITAWVSPQQQCNYCHVPGEDFAKDTLYTKVVARRMIQMTQHVNADWKTHVGATGVTCYTCHRGQPVPANVWFNKPGPLNKSTMLGERANQNEPAKNVGLSSLPNDHFQQFLSKAEQIRVIGNTALPTGNRRSTKEAEWTYGLMMHMSSSLGVNCTYCHNTRSMAVWDAGSPQRATAWYGIRMARDLNNNYVDPLQPVFPASQLGPTGDVGKVNCATCHQGAYKPLYGESMLKDHMILAAPAAIALTPDPQVTATGAVVYFAVGRSDVKVDLPQSLAVLVEALKANPASKVAISGYHSASGDLATNQELAKNRAFAVRDALKAAGIGEDRMMLEKPLSAEANLAGEDPKARRVDVSLK
jgi:photosynthetic reaction center cytochrome c subunit